MWIIKLVRPTIGNIYPTGFFPRKVRYKVDAMEYKRQIEKVGGLASIEKEKAS
jgi:hypothetical protein